MKKECKYTLEEWDVIRWKREPDKSYARYCLVERDKDNWWLVGLIYTEDMIRYQYPKNKIQELLNEGELKVVQELQ